MPYIAYEEKNFHDATLRVIHQAEKIIQEYTAQGYGLTLRQLYYQFVARDLIANTMRDYKRLGRIVSDARRAGLLDWYSIEDRTRNLMSLAHWEDPSDIIRGAAGQFRVDLWEGQPRRVEVWIEKEALAGVFDRVCQAWDVPLFPCRGYPSDSEVWSAAQRLRAHRIETGNPPVVLHFGDHDPSGIDMSRDIEDRLALFGARVEVRRVALNMDQVDEYDPPPNPAKETDSRFRDYSIHYGDESWELDALEPSVLSDLVADQVDALLDWEEWEARKAIGEEGRSQLRRVSDRWDDVVEFLDG